MLALLAIIKDLFKSTNRLIWRIMSRPQEKKIKPMTSTPFLIAINNCIDNQGTLLAVITQINLPWLNFGFTLDLNILSTVDSLLKPHGSAGRKKIRCLWWSTIGYCFLNVKWMFDLFILIGACHLLKFMTPNQWHLCHYWWGC